LNAAISGVMPFTAARFTSAPAASTSRVRLLFLSRITSALVRRLRELTLAPAARLADARRIGVGGDQETGIDGKALSSTGCAKALPRRNWASSSRTGNFTRTGTLIQK
jgi:hypothetical protein